MSDRRGLLAVDEAPIAIDTRPAPDAPVSTGDVIGAHARLGYQDWAGSAEQDYTNAYGPLVGALDARDTRGWFRKAVDPKGYLSTARSGFPINEFKVWADIAAARKADPDFLKDVPANNAAEFRAWIDQRRLGQRRVAQDVVRRQSGLGQGLIGFTADIGVGLADPINLMTLPLGGAGATKSLLSVVARDALVNATIEAIEMPAIVANRAQFGEEMDAGDIATDLAFAGVAGGAFRLAGEGVKRLASPVIDRLRAGGASDAEVAAAFAEAVHPDRRTADEAAALHVIEREAEIRSANPFEDSPAGMDAHADKLEAAMRAVLGVPDPAPRALAGGTALSTGTVAPPVSRETLGGTSAPSPIDAVFDALIAQESSGRAGIAGPMTPYGQAHGLTQVLDSTGEAMARKLGIAWRPDLMRGTSDEAAAYQRRIGRAYFEEGLARYQGDVRKALMFYHGGPDERKWGPKTRAYADRVLGRVGDVPELRRKNFAEGVDGEAAWLTAQAALDAEELGLHSAAPRVPVQLAPDEVPEAATMFGRDPSGATVAARIEAPEAVSVVSPSPPEPVSDMDAADAVRAYVGGTRESVQPKIIAARLGIAEDQARRAMALIAGEPGSGLAARKGGGFTRTRAKAPEDLLTFLAKRGGLRDDEGHDLIGTGIPRIAPRGGVLVRKDGMSLDTARELAAEAGYFHRDPDAAISETTGADFLDLLAGAGDTPHYALADLDVADELARDRVFMEDLADARASVAQALADERIVFTPVEQMRAAARIARNGKSVGDALAEIINEHAYIALDDAALEAENARYADLADAIEDALRAGDRDLDGSGGGSGAASGDAGRGVARGEEPGGAAADEREAAGLAGPPPLHPPAGGAFDDPDGAGAKAVADSLDHDVRADLDRGAETNPAAAERQRQEAQLRADGPMRAQADQESTIGAPLFDAADQGTFALEEGGPERPIRDILDEIDADEAAIKAARDCL